MRLARFIVAFVAATVCAFAFADNRQMFFGSFLPPTVPPPAIVGSCATGAFPNGAAGNTATATLSGVTAGNTIIAEVIGYDSSGASGNLITVTDGSGYTADVQFEQVNSGGKYQQVGIFRLSSVSSGTHAVVATNAAGTFASFGLLVACEVSHLTQSSADAVAHNSAADGASNNPTSGNSTALAPQSITFSVLSLNDTSSSIAFGHPPSGYTSIATLLNGSTTAVGGSTDYIVQNGTETTQNPSYATFTNTHAWVVAAAVYH